VAPEFGSRTPARPRGHLVLFTGCVGRHLEAGTRRAAVEVLTRLGYAVTIPEPACCCGALHRHDGFGAEADAQLGVCEKLLGGGTCDAVLTLASACCGELRRSDRLAPRVRDISRFLAQEQWPRDALHPCSDPVRIHVPCTQRNLLHDPDAAADMLRAVPGLEPVPLADNAVCCGAAGTYMLRERALSQALLDDKLQAIAAALGSTGGILVTSNTGCALHLSAGIRARGLPVEVLHPVELLARQLRPPKAAA
jgi:glycolate oxidase iron-sulfur subunit